MDGKTIFISGGMGSFGTAFTKYLVKNHSPKKIVLFCRGEENRRQSQKYFSEYSDIIRWLTGDIRDYDRLLDAMKGADIVIHAAAMKDIDLCAHDPIEAIKTNIYGTENIVQACCRIDSIEKAVYLSTDKAVAPANLYGATKMTAEKLWLNANFKSFKFSACRYGNVVRSKGSVLNKWAEKRDALKEHDQLRLDLTDRRMTRFWLEYSDAIRCVKEAIRYPAGHIIISNTRSFRLLDLGIAFNACVHETGIRPGEKLHETLVAESELPRTIMYPDYYVIKPEYVYKEMQYEYEPGAAVEYEVNSGSAERLSVADLEKKIG